MFESIIIDQKINQIQQQFFKNFLVFFMMPLLLIVVLMLIGEVVFIVCFSRQIFSTINDLYHKINMLSKQQREKLKIDKNKFINHAHNSLADETLRTLEAEGEAYFDQLTYRRFGSGSFRNGSIKSKDQIPTNSSVDVLQDYEGRESCMEVTKLYRAANKLIKTLSLARTSMMVGNDNTALLSYNEVAHLFQEKHKHMDQDSLLSLSQVNMDKEGAAFTPMKKRDNNNYSETKVEEFTQIAHSKLLLGTDGENEGDGREDVDNGEIKNMTVQNRHIAICYNNIGCIHAKKKNYALMSLYFEESIRIEEHLVYLSKIEKNFTSIEENVRLGYRYYNYGYSQYKQYISLKKNPKSKSTKFINGNKVFYGALKNLKMAYNCFQILAKGSLHQRYVNTQERNFPLSVNDETEPSQKKYQRTFKDVCLYLKLLILELKILSPYFPTNQIVLKMSRLSGIVIEYIKSDEYEEMLDVEKRERSRNSKGVWYFTRDYLIQYTLFLHGIFFEQRGIEIMTQEAQAESARTYYLLSFASPQLYEVEHGLMKRALKQLMKVSAFNIEQRSQLVLSKFYVKYRSVQVIMEQCNEAPYAHDILISFVKRSIFDRLRDHDYFSFVSMRSGKKPYLALPLELKHCNSKLKQKTLNEFNLSSKMTPLQERCTDLSMALLSCINATKDMPSTEVEVYGERFMDPMNWIVAIVGPQTQELERIINLIKRSSIKKVPNIIIIGVNITDRAECDKYRALCHLTQEGQFVNLDFNQKVNIEKDINPAKNEENLNPKYVHALQCVEAALQLYTQKTMPLICEHIEFN
ncbi:hypothetical protein FGO68_gene15390 [Halteria grandinella]|uniref:Uncharacterized protein n=1 Tax=Halteria grandinella TaxID=5974 RepID=A0A8J8T8V7_HALGN|nr:hypothetical protein FGO68_gene15390 [Halteria grandinella]